MTHPPNPHPREPFEDPREIDPLEHYDPLQRAPVFNPRSKVVPADVSITEDDYDLLALDKQTPSLEEIRGMISRYESRLEGSVEDAPTDPLKSSYEKGAPEGRKPGQSIIEEFSEDEKYDARIESPLVTFTRGYSSFVERVERRLTADWSHFVGQPILPNDEAMSKRAVVALPLLVLIVAVVAASTSSRSTGDTASDLFAVTLSAYANFNN